MPGGIRRVLYLLEDSALVGLVVTMVVLSFSQLVLRNLDVSGMTWSDAALRVNVLWLAMFGALRASRLQNHIAIDLLSHYLPDQARRPTHLVVSLASSMICATAAYYSYRFVVLEKEDGMIAFLGVPVWICEAIIPAALFVIALRFLLGATELPESHADQS
jgi:TRAP-type C4-dicarboxylate transport system permease small subunit